MQSTNLFDVLTPLGFRIHTPRIYWAHILGKHPEMAELVDEVAGTLMNPDEVWHSLADPEMYEFYRVLGRRQYLRVVVRNEPGGGFLISAYPTDYIKARVKVWPK